MKKSTMTPTKKDRRSNGLYLSEYYSAYRDGEGWVLHYLKTRVNEEGKEIVSEHKWYYPNLRLCLKKYLDHSLTDTGDVKRLFQELESLNQKIDQLCKK